MLHSSASVHLPPVLYVQVQHVGAACAALMLHEQAQPLYCLHAAWRQPRTAQLGAACLIGNRTLIIAWSSCVLVHRLATAPALEAGRRAGQG